MVGPAVCCSPYVRVAGCCSSNLRCRDHKVVVMQVPYDPELPFLFFGEEMGMLARLWTRGWDVMAPSQVCQDPAKSIARLSAAWGGYIYTLTATWYTLCVKRKIECRKSHFHPPAPFPSSLPLPPPSIIHSFHMAHGTCCTTVARLSDKGGTAGMTPSFLDIVQCDHGTIMTMSVLWFCLAQKHGPQLQQLHHCMAVRLLVVKHEKAGVLPSLQVCWVM